MWPELTTASAADELQSSRRQRLWLRTPPRPELARLDAAARASSVLLQADGRVARGRQPTQAAMVLASQNAMAGRAPVSAGRGWALGQRALLPLTTPDANALDLGCWPTLAPSDGKGVALIAPVPTTAGTSANPLPEHSQPGARRPTQCAATHRAAEWAAQRQVLAPQAPSVSDPSADLLRGGSTRKATTLRRGGPQRAGRHFRSAALCNPLAL